MTIFGPQQLSQIVSDSLASANLPADHTNAIIVTTDTSGASVVASVKLGADQQWDIQGYYRHDFDSKQNTVGAKVVYSW